MAMTHWFFYCFFLLFLYCLFIFYFRPLALNLLAYIRPSSCRLSLLWCLPGAFRSPRMKLLPWPPPSDFSRNLSRATQSCHASTWTEQNTATKAATIVLNQVECQVQLSVQLPLSALSSSPILQSTNDECSRDHIPLLKHLCHPN
jgi:hypothetical protein